MQEWVRMGTRMAVVVLAALWLAGTPADAQPEVSSPPQAGMASEADAAPASGVHESQQNTLGLLFFVFVLAIFLGVELISKVPSQLHTPLMSGSNAISGISIVGAIVATGLGEGKMMVTLGTLAVAFAMINVVGGYLVTDRMLGMFKHKGGERK